MLEISIFNFCCWNSILSSKHNVRVSSNPKGPAQKMRNNTEPKSNCRKKVNASLIASNAIENPQLIGDLIFIIGDFHDHINSLAKKINAYFAVMVRIK